MKIPTTLKDEPLVESKFEIRIVQDCGFPEILPGILHENFDPKPKIKKLPVSELPTKLCKQDPNLTFVPLIELELEKYRILVGDRNVLVSCKLPYPRWPSFKEVI